MTMAYYDYQTFHPENAHCFNCGKQFEIKDPTLSGKRNGERVFFCCQACFADWGCRMFSVWGR
jgi:hypothetical protein